MYAKQFLQKIFVSLMLVLCAAGTTTHAASVDGILRSIGLRNDQILNFTHKGKHYHARLALHNGHEALHVTDEKDNEAILVRVNGKWVEYRTFGQKLGGAVKKGAVVSAIGIGVSLALSLTALSALTVQLALDGRGRDIRDLGEYRWRLEDAASSDWKVVRRILYSTFGIGSNPDHSYL